MGSSQFQLSAGGKQTVTPFHGVACPGDSVDGRHLSRLAVGQSGQDARNEGKQVATAVASGTHDEDSDLVLRHALLKREVAVNSQKDIKALLGECQQTTVLDGGPTHLGNMLDFMPREFPGEPFRDALVEENLHIRKQRRPAVPSPLPRKQSLVRV